MNTNLYLLLCDFFVQVTGVCVCVYYIYVFAVVMTFKYIISRFI